MLALTACETHQYRTLNPDCASLDRSLKYNRDGHQDTVFLVAMMAGRSTRDASLLSFYTQAPDDVSLRFEANYVSVWGSFGPWRYRHRINAILHSLHGGDLDESLRRRALLLDVFQGLDQTSPDYYWKAGLVLHAFGDSYAHTNESGATYGEFFGHLFDGHAPDQIGQRPELYLSYVEMLFEALNEGEGDSTALATFRQDIRRLEGEPPSAYTHLIEVRREAIPKSFSLACKDLVDQMELHRIDTFLGEIESRFEAGLD